MTLLRYVTAALARADVRHAVIGAAAMAIRGVGRSTHDIDLLTLSRACLDASWWTTPAGVDVAVRRGDAHDPLAGVVRVEQAGWAIRRFRRRLSPVAGADPQAR